jgi:hypothetical protein
MRVVPFILTTTVVLSAASCTEKPEVSKKAEEKAAPEAKTETETETETETRSKAEVSATSVEPPEPWKRVDADALPQSAKARLQEAQKAKKALGQKLMGELTAAVQGGDFARGVEVCKKAAPQVAKTVSSRYDVEIGRTSFKVRNPDNRPRDWAEPFVEARVTEDVVLTGPENTVAYMSPIKMAEVCTNCHGAADQIPGEVERMLAEKYPQDEATGFAEGDLRGWFWVEVRP